MKSERQKYQVSQTKKRFLLSREIWDKSAFNIKEQITLAAYLRHVLQIYFSSFFKVYMAAVEAIIVWWQPDIKVNMRSRDERCVAGVQPVTVN